MKRRNLIVSILLLVLAIALLIETMKMPVGTFASPGGGFFPLGLSVVLGILSFVLLLQTIKGKHEEESPPWATAGNLGPLVMTIGVLFLYVFVFELLGYLISTFFLIGLIMAVFGPMKWWKVVTIALISATLSYFLFTAILGMSMPKGLLEGILR
jgi:putative tricarboxylic transport membrane protein